MKKTGWSNKTKSLRKVGKVMHEFKEGELHVGKSDKVVKNPKQAIAIALSEAGMSKKVKGGGTKKRSLMSMANLVDWKGEGIKKWYMRSYPTDELGEELNDDVTFKDLMDALNNKQDVYEIMGVADSVVRERLFEYLSLVYDVDYDVIYKKWLDSDDYAKGGGVDMESVEEEIRSLKSRIKSLEEINTKEAYEQSNELRKQLSYLQAKYLHIKDFKYAKGGGVEDSATVIIISQNKPLAKQIGTGWDDIYNSYGVSLVEKDGKKYIVFTYNYVSQVDKYVITDDISYIMKTYGISNVEWDNLSDKRYALEMSKNEYAEGGGVGDNKFTYMMLSRLQSDNDYFLGYGNRSERNLWAGNVDAQISEMKRLWNSLPKNAKPEWLSMEDILDYERKMKNQYADGGNLDLNDWDLPVIRSQFEEEEFEYGGGGAIFSRTMKTPDGTIVGKVDYNDFWKTYQVVIDGVVYEEFKTKEEAIQNLKNAGFGKMQLGGGIPNNYFGKTPEEVWNEWTETQRLHFLIDHRLTDLHSSKIMIPFSELPESIKRAVKFHRAEGQYADGGEVDINDWDMPIIRTQFEDEEYEFEKGGEITDEERKQSLKNNLKLKF